MLVHVSVFTTSGSITLAETFNALKLQTVNAPEIKAAIILDFFIMSLLFFKSGLHKAGQKYYSSVPTEEITSVSRFAGSCSYLSKSKVKLPMPLVV